MNSMRILYIVLIVGIIIALGLTIGLVYGLKKDNDKDNNTNYKSYKNYKKINSIYINLDNRTDRNKQILDELKYFHTNYYRLSATYNEKGYLGCSMSHIRSLEYAIEKKLDNVIIFEDDFKFTRNQYAVYHEIIQFMNTVKDWDVLLLASNEEEIQYYNIIVGKVTNAQTTSAYLVNKNYYQKLLNHLKIGYTLLEKTGNIHNYAADMYWKLLQETDNWFILRNKAGVQRESYSDIEGRVVDYGV